MLTMFIDHQMRSDFLELEIIKRAQILPAAARQKLGQHRSQGVWAKPHLVCIVTPNTHGFILTPSTQNRLTSHRS